MGLFHPLKVYQLSTSVGVTRSPPGYRFRGDSHLGSSPGLTLVADDHPMVRALIEVPWNSEGLEKSIQNP